MYADSTVNHDYFSRKYITASRRFGYRLVRSGLNVKENVELISYNYGDFVITKGDDPDGLFIILTGLTYANYDPSNECIRNWHDYGALPNCDYVTHLNFSKSQQDIIVPGNVIGELGLISGDPYEYTVTCMSSVQAYHLSSEVMHVAMDLPMESGPCLEMKIWKTICIRIAFMIVSQIPKFHSWPPAKLKAHLECGFVLVVEFIDSIKITEYMQDLFLIQGVTYDGKTKVQYLAPCYLPHSIKLLQLTNIDSVEAENLNMAPVRLYAIPEEGVSEAEVIESMNDINPPGRLSEMVPPTSYRNKTLTGDDENIIMNLSNKYSTKGIYNQPAPKPTNEEELSLSRDSSGISLIEQKSPISINLNQVVTSKSTSVVRTKDADNLNENKDQEIAKKEKYKNETGNEKGPVTTDIENAEGQSKADNEGLTGDKESHGENKAEKSEIKEKDEMEKEKEKDPVSTDVENTAGQSKENNEELTGGKDISDSSFRENKLRKAK